MLNNPNAIELIRENITNMAISPMHFSSLLKNPAIFDKVGSVGFGKKRRSKKKIDSELIYLRKFLSSKTVRKFRKMEL